MITYSPEFRAWKEKIEALLCARGFPPGIVGVHEGLSWRDDFEEGKSAEELADHITRTDLTHAFMAEQTLLMRDIRKSLVAPLVVVRLKEMLENSYEWSGNTFREELRKVIEEFDIPASPDSPN